eukprot:GHUV01006142.1.p1 GENE.GHUV01006142.1~~GHUV01006142.1.p1  ORF type:complete len:145 (+),score=25.70 GHUV01006142.1:275-709(+)
MSKKTSVTEDEAIQRRISHAQWLSGLLEDPDSVASVTVAAYADILDDICLDVAVEAHREFRTGVMALQTTVYPQQHPAPLEPLPGVKGATDVFGQVHPGTATDVVICMNCGRKAQAGKFAYHLEKCLGKGRVPGGTRVSRRTGV